ncbi:MAG: hypothetical protein HY270_06240 [Deltaproteobacteria bacterium]|nr:hypothetical protein [Deltaproteobacteria bacterium]
MKRSWSVALLCAGGTLLAALPASALGPKKLKQPKAFPITITTPGSYVLMSNLDVTKTGQANPEDLSTAKSNGGTQISAAGIAGQNICDGVPCP